MKSLGNLTGPASLLKNWHKLAKKWQIKLDQDHILVSFVLGRQQGERHQLLARSINKEFDKIPTSEPFIACKLKCNHSLSTKELYSCNTAM